MLPCNIRALTKRGNFWCPNGIFRRPFRNITYRLLIFFALSVSVNGNSMVAAQSPRMQEYQVKAAFIFNFANFVEWPDRAFPSKESSFVVGVLGSNPFGDALNSLKGKTVKGRRVEIRNYSEAEEIDCQILFISSSEQGNLPFIMKSLKGIPVLIVGDQEGFCRNGGMINLTPVGNRIGFEVNDSVARKVGLKISSQLLKLAREIIE